MIIKLNPFKINYLFAHLLTYEMFQTSHSPIFSRQQFLRSSREKHFCCKTIGEESNVSKKTGVNFVSGIISQDEYH